MKHESAVQAVKELMRKDSVFRSVIQGWGVATLLIGLFMFYMGANTYIQSYKQTDWVFGSAYITDISELNRSKVGRGGINYSMTYEYEVDTVRLPSALESCSAVWLLGAKPPKMVSWQLSVNISAPSRP